MSISVPTSKKSLCRTPILRYKPVIFANNVGLYIDSQQTINRLRPLTLVHYTEFLSLSTHRSGEVTACRNSYFGVRTARVVYYHQQRLYYAVAKNIIFGGYHTTVKLPPADLFRHVIRPGKTFQRERDFISWHHGCLAAMAEYATICAWNNCYFLQIFR